MNRFELQDLCSNRNGESEIKNVFEYRVIGETYLWLQG